LKEELNGAAQQQRWNSKPIDRLEEKVKQLVGLIDIAPADRSRANGRSVAAAAGSPGPAGPAV
jgi:hypothetical protein